MRLRSGQALLHVHLVEKVGEGGMGEVWKAVDTTLDREVAIKVLPEAFAGDRERVARLEREAKLLASLNHPNIAAIHGFPEVDLSPSGGTKVRFLAMELVPGEELAEVLARGPLPIPEALDAARQIAAALEAAHERGVIHRDLKPANVKRTPEGRIKVLDFGLAKAHESASTGGAQTATVTSAGSTAGLIVGTASYMSPEQARGQTVDRRTDLWSFGCVLYEMLAGVKAFDGATVTDVLAAVVTGEPDWKKLPAATPAPVRRLLRRCLEKDARRRLRDAGDASLLLDDSPEEPGTAPVPRARTASTSVLAGLGLVLAIAGAAGGWWLSRGGSRESAAAAVAFHRVTFGRGMLRSARFAPDGRTIVYGAAWGGPPVQLYLARTDAPESAPLPTPPAELLSISRSGDLAVALRHSYYGWMSDGTLARTSLLGGAPREVLEHVRAADWSPDGSQLAIVRRVGGVDRLEYPVGTVLDETPGYFSDPRVAPDGGRVAYADHPSWGDNRGGIAVVDRSGKKTTLASGFEAVQGVAWTPGGREVWFTDIIGDEGTVRAVDLAGAVRVVYSSIAPVELFDIAADGRVLLGRHRPDREVLALLAGESVPRMLVVPGESSMGRGIAADGGAVLVSNHSAREYETFVIRPGQPGAVRLSLGDAGGISPDGTLALTASADNRVLSVSPLGTGATRPIPNPDQVVYESIPGWLPDGKRIVVVGRIGSAPSRGFVCEIASGDCEEFGGPGVMWPLFIEPPASPDGRYVILQDAGGTPKRWPIDGGDGLAIPGTRPEDQQLQFTEDGQGLFVTGRTVPMVIERLDLATGRRSAWLTLSPTDPAGLRYAVAAITPNGKYWALSTAKLLTDLYVVEGLR